MHYFSLTAVILYQLFMTLAPEMSCSAKVVFVFAPSSSPSTSQLEALLTRCTFLSDLTVMTFAWEIFCLVVLCVLSRIKPFGRLTAKNTRHCFAKEQNFSLIIIIIMTPCWANTDGYNLCCNKVVSTKCLASFTTSSGCRKWNEYFQRLTGIIIYLKKLLPFHNR